jgi:hypothetical protein
MCKQTFYVVLGEWYYDGGRVLGITSTYEKGKKLGEEMASEMACPWDYIRVEDFEVDVRKQ